MQSCAGNQDDLRRSHYTRTNILKRLIAIGSHDAKVGHVLDRFEPVGEVPGDLRVTGQHDRLESLADALGQSLHGQLVLRQNRSPLVADVEPAHGKQADGDADRDAAGDLVTYVTHGFHEKGRWHHSYDVEDAAEYSTPETSAPGWSAKATRNQPAGAMAAAALSIYAPCCSMPGAGGQANRTDSTVLAD